MAVIPPEKSEKNMKSHETHWKKRMRWIILSLSISLISLCLTCTLYADDRPNVSDQMALQEAKVARESAESRAVALELELERLRKDYDELRSRYAELYLRGHATLDRMRELELQAANLVQNKGAGDARGTSQQALEALNLTLDRQLNVQRSLDDFEKFMSTLMDTLRPSDALRRELEQRISALHGAVEQSLKPLSIVARRGSSGGSPNSGATVVAIHADMQIVILDRGLLAGIRPGRKWHLALADGTVAARLQTVDCRQEFSAAVVLSGDLEQFSIGNVVLPE